MYDSQAGTPLEGFAEFAAAAAAEGVLLTLVASTASTATSCRPKVLKVEECEPPLDPPGVR